MASVENLKIFGLSEQKAKETLKNTTVTNNLLNILSECRGVEIPQDVGILLYHMASRIKPQITSHLAFLTEYIVKGKLNNVLRVDSALEYLLANVHALSTLNIAEFEEVCGVGIVVSPEEIEREVQKEIQNNVEAIKDQRYRFNVGKVMQKVRENLKWADGKLIKSEIDVQLFELLGAKTAADLSGGKQQNSKKENVPNKPKPNVQEKEVKSSPNNATTIVELMKKVDFHAPGENYKTDGYVVTENTQNLLRNHLIQTGGKVITRFPPEPNGVLHIGHAKAINVNFGYAAAHNGLCYLRYDDTNPEKEEERFFVGIKEMVEWLGYKPFKVTHSSDYFQQLYEWAIVLIKKEKAYVCHQSGDEMKGFNPVPSPWRDRPVEENLRLFEDMKNGKIDEGKATLRMKLTLQEGKMDPVAYRIKFVPHHRTKNDWCIYPTYDYTHCLCDSLENITHSLCTKEFQSRRSSYYWLCNSLDIYCPVQWEYGRLNISYTVVSKRKIAKLISERIVNSWDDPRLFTLSALRRRGFPAEAINSFCAQIGLTGAQITIEPSMLEACVRDVLNVTAPRRLVVLEPLKVTIENFPFDKPKVLQIPNFPLTTSGGHHEVVFDRVIYIEKSDFRVDADKSYRRLTLNQSVGLRHAGFVIKVTKVNKDDSGEITSLVCVCEESETAQKPKAFIQWVSKPVEIEVRLYEPLFHHKNPEDLNEVPGGFISDCNLESLKVMRAFTSESLLLAKVYEKYQFERIGFFSVDPDSVGEKLVFNRTVTLKEGKL